MRAYVNLCGWTLSDQGLRRAVREARTAVKTSEGSAVDCETEADVFMACGLPYRRPEERDAEAQEITVSAQAVGMEVVRS
jgi:DNA polymerase/3'-5' exonuclease PolX